MHLVIQHMSLQKRDSSCACVKSTMSSTAAWAQQQQIPQQPAPSCLCTASFHNTNLRCMLLKETRTSSRCNANRSELLQQHRKCRAAAHLVGFGIERAGVQQRVGGVHGRLGDGHVDGGCDVTAAAAQVRRVVAGAGAPAVHAACTKWQQVGAPGCGRANMSRRGKVSSLLILKTASAAQWLLTHSPAGSFATATSTSCMCVWRPKDGQKDRITGICASSPLRVRARAKQMLPGWHQQLL